MQETINWMKEAIRETRVKFIEEKTLELQNNEMEAEEKLISISIKTYVAKTGWDLIGIANYGTASTPHQSPSKDVA